MLNDARARNEVLSQAYAELHAEYVKLKSTPPASSSHLDAAHHGHGHGHGHGHSHPMPGSAYSTMAGTSVSTADLSAGFVDPASMAVLNAGSDLDAYLYPEVASYSL